MLLKPSLSAAQRIEPFAPRTAHHGHLEALAAAVWAAGPGDRELVAKAAQAARATSSAENPPRTAELVLDAIATRMTEGYAAATPALTAARDAIRNHGLGSDDADDLLWLTGNRLAGLIATEAWDTQRLFPPWQSARSESHESREPWYSFNSR